MAVKNRKKHNITFQNVNSLLDETNVALLEHLSMEPRLPIRELARRVNMSAPAVTERIQRMRETGVIRGEWLEIDRQALGLGVSAYVRIRPMPGALPRIAELARKSPQIVECHRVTGEECFIMQVVAASVGALESLLDEFLQFGNTSTSLIVSSPVPLRAPPLPHASV